MSDWDNLVEPARAALEALIRKGDAAADRIEELEAQLAKAVTALEFYGGWSDSSGGICGFDGGSRARTTLAELKGQDDE